MLSGTRPRHLAPTPPERLLDEARRPYFLWDVDLDVDAFRERLWDPDPEVRAYWLGKLMRQAKPDDVFLFVTLEDIEAQWEGVQPFLGKSRPFWAWAIERWREARVFDGKETTALDLVADPVPMTEAPQRADLSSGFLIQADTPYEILVNKLCALLSRVEPRDLADVRVLVASGLDLSRAIDDAPRKDAGFSAATLAWVLSDASVDAGLRSGAVSAQEAEELLRFRQQLVKALMQSGHPET